jgi:hypothetical protein
MGLRYKIQVSKEDAQVTAHWDVSVAMSDTELISSFILTVEGKSLDTQCARGNKACRGAAFATLANPAQDCPVTFVITTNKPTERHGVDILRGNRRFDDVGFNG